MIKCLKNEIEKHYILITTLVENSQKLSNIDQACILKIQLIYINFKTVWEFAHCSFAHHSFAHLLIAHLLICSKLLISMSNCERFAQNAQDK